MKKYVCNICGWEYDPQSGAPETGAAPGTAFEDLPENFQCPVCGADKDTFSPAPEGYEWLGATVFRSIQLTPTIKSLQLKPDQPLSWLPGQHTRLSFGPDEDLEHFLSVSNACTGDGVLEVTKRITDSAFSSAFSAARPGDRERVICPRGDFLLPDERQGVVLIAGGIGITPFMSMLKAQALSGKARELLLLYVNRNESDMPFSGEIEEISHKCPALKVVYFITNPTPDWRGERGRITADSVRKYAPGFKEDRFMVCGSPAMVTGTRELLLKEVGAKPENVLVEEFPGYI